jgi:hypothetical protein
MSRCVRVPLKGTLSSIEWKSCATQQYQWTRGRTSGMGKGRKRSVVAIPEAARWCSPRELSSSSSVLIETWTYSPRNALCTRTGRPVRADISAFACMTELSHTAEGT